MIDYLFLGFYSLPPLSFYSTELEATSEIPEVQFGYVTTVNPSIFGKWIAQVENELICDRFVLFLEGTTAITANVSSQHLVKLRDDVIRMRDWNKLKTLYLGGGGPSSQPVGGGGLAININSSSVPLGEVIRHFDPKEELITALLEHGASANVIDGSNVIPLEEAMSRENLPLVEKLVQKGANYCLACSDGEPIVHKALRKGLKSGNLNEISFTRAHSYLRLFQWLCYEASW